MRVLRLAQRFDVALLLWNQVVVDDLQFLCWGLLARNVHLLVQLLADLIRFFLYLDVVGVVVPVNVGASLLRRGTADSLVRIGLSEQIRIALLVSLEALADALPFVHVCVMLGLILVLFGDGKVLLAILELEVEPLEILHAPLGGGSSRLAVTPLVLDAESEGEVLYASHRLRHVEVWPEVARLLPIVSVLGVGVIIAPALFAFGVEASSKLLLKGFLGILAASLLVLVDDGVSRLLPAHCCQALVRELQDSTLKGLHFALLGRPPLSLLSPVSVQLIDGVGIYGEAHVEVLWFGHRLVSILAPIGSGSGPPLLLPGVAFLLALCSCWEAFSGSAGKVLGSVLTEPPLVTVLAESCLHGPSIILVLVQTRVFQVKHEVLLEFVRPLWQGERLVGLRGVRVGRRGGTLV